MNNNLPPGCSQSDIDKHFESNYVACDACEGTGKVDGEDCGDCNGEGDVTLPTWEDIMARRIDERRERERERMWDRE